MSMNATMIVAFLSGDFKVGFLVPVDAIKPLKDILNNGANVWHVYESLLHKAQTGTLFIDRYSVTEITLPDSWIGLTILCPE